MLYNIKDKKIMNFNDCTTCEHYDKKSLTCNGINKKCFLYDSTTQTIIDGITKLPLQGEKL